MRKLVSALAITAGLTLLAAPAFAQDDEYPPETTEELTVSESTVEPGDSITISGEGAEPGATVTFRLTRSSSTVSLGSTTAEDDGTFSATLTIPSSVDPGVYTLTATSGGEVLATATIRVLADATTGDLPFTGSNVAPGLAIGATLIVAGGLLLLAVRRRRSSVA